MKYNINTIECRTILRVSYCCWTHVEPQSVPSVLAWQNSSFLKLQKRSWENLFKKLPEVPGNGSGIVSSRAGAGSLSSNGVSGLPKSSPPKSDIPPPGDGGLRSFRWVVESSRRGLKPLKLKLFLIFDGKQMLNYYLIATITKQWLESTMCVSLAV